MRRGWRGWRGWRQAFVAAVVGVIVLAGCDAPTRPEHTVRLRDYSVTGSFQPNGFVEMQATAQYPSVDGGPLRLGAPTLGDISEVQLDRSPRSATGETVDLDPQGARVFVSWTVRGATERYADGVIVTLPVWTAPNGVDHDDKRVTIEGSLQLPAAPLGKVRWHGASSANVTVDGTTIHFVGEIGTTTSSEMSFLLPAGSLPVAPVLPGASRVASYAHHWSLCQASKTAWKSIGARPGA